MEPQTRIYVEERTYIKKDGTPSIKHYQRTYTPVDKASKITQKKIIDRIKGINSDKYPAVYDILAQFIQE